MLLKNIDEEVASAREEVEGDRDAPSLKNPSAFGYMAYGLIGNVLLATLHKINYVGEYTFSALGPHVAIFFAIQVPLSAVSLRQYIRVPTTLSQRAFVITYDVLVELSFLRQHVLLTLFSILGVRSTEYLTLELLDIMTISPVIKDIILSIAGKATELVLVGALFIITCVIYAAFGMANFIDYMKPGRFSQISDDQVYSYSYSYTDDEAGVDSLQVEESFYRGEAPTFMERVLKAGKGKQAIRSVLENPECSNLLGCTYFFFHEGLGEAGNAKAFLMTANPGDSDYIPRILFDSM